MQLSKSDGAGVVKIIIHTVVECTRGLKRPCSSSACVENKFNGCIFLS